VVTETGYASAGARGQAVDEVVQAKYLLLLLANAWQHGTRHIYLYQLVDDKAEPREWSRNLGLYRFDWSAKPAALALHHLTAALARAGAPSTAAVPDLALVGAPAGTGSLWLRGARESLLLLWREQPLWDDVANAARAPRIEKLRLSGARRTLTRIDPLTGDELTIEPDEHGYSVELGGHPVLLRVN
jgi:hypothetical protein